MKKTRKEIMDKYCASEKGKKARREYARKYRETDAYKAYRKKYKKTDAFKAWRKTEAGKRSNRNSHLKKRYGITIDDYEQMLKDQNNKCAICGNGHTKGTRGKLYIDHCHKTNKVRGLLCQKCNSAIGLLGDNKTLLKKALKYLL